MYLQFYELLLYTYMKHTPKANTINDNSGHLTLYQMSDEQVVIMHLSYFWVTKLLNPLKCA